MSGQAAYCHFHSGPWEKRISLPRDLSSESPIREQGYDGAEGIVKQALFAMVDVRRERTDDDWPSGRSTYAYDNGRMEKTDESHAREAYGTIPKLRSVERCRRVQGVQTDVGHQGNTRAEKRG